MEATKVLNLEFTVKEIEFIINALGKFPYAEVAGMISNIQQQATKQLVPDVPVSKQEKEEE